jgi:hypothetical protein
MAKIIGAEALKRKFREMPGAVQAEVKKAVPDAADELVGMMQRLAPRNKGVLVASIRREQLEEFRAAVIAGGTPATRREIRKGSGQFTDEAILAEFGTKPHRVGGKFKGARHPGTAPQPFFYSSWRAMKKRIKSKIARSITTGIKKVAKSGG